MKKKEKFYLSSKKHVGASNQPLVFFIFTCLIFFVTGARLFWIQIINGSYYNKLSEEHQSIIDIAFKAANIDMI